MQITVVSPHRDDAAFSLSLTIATWIKQGHKINVLNCFTESKYAPYTHTVSKDQRDRLQMITAIRCSEDERWSCSFGSSVKTGSLGLKDAPLRLDCSSDAVCDLPVLSADPALVRIKETLRGGFYEALVLPLALGGHVDHVTALKGSVAMSDSTRCAFYEDLPYATRRGVFEGIARVASGIDGALMPVFSSAESKDVECAIAYKRKLVLCYDSQIGAGEAAEIAAYSRQFQGRERLWVNAAWRRSELTFGDAGF